jgi:hypothetical protein
LKAHFCFLVPLVALALLLTPPALAQSLTHRYSFINGDATDSVDGMNGTVLGNVTFQTDPDNPGANGNAVFGGGNSSSNPGYISLPTSTVSSLQNATLEMFTTGFDASIQPNFEALFAVSSAFPDTSNYTVLAANRDGTQLGTGSRTGGGPETVVAGADPLPDGVHVVDLVYSGFSGIGSTGLETLYLDGFQVAQGQTVFSFADVAAGPGGIATVGIGGGSPFGDPTFQGSLNEVRLFNGALTQDEITADVNTGPGDLGFTPVPIPASVPEASTIISFGLLLALGGLFAVRRSASYNH